MSCQIRKGLSLLFVLSVLSGCAAVSPKDAYGVKTSEHGQCRMLNKGERISYKRKPVSFVCEDRYVLVGEPYKRGDLWYFKSASYDGKKVSTLLSEVKVEKSLYNICHLEGSYGTGEQKIEKFYFDTKLQSCRPFSWSGKDGIVPFSSVDICEMHCNR